MDINKILGLKHLIDAESDQQRRWAISEFNSSFDQSYQLMRNQLLRSMALCETIIDFSEDGSIDDRLVWNQAIDQILRFKSTVIDQLSRSERREKISNGIKLSLYGSPNVGKSTLMNYLVNRQAAIVSPYPGTTRDVIELPIDYHGFPIILSDTAGLRTTQDPVERLGIEKAKEKIESADVRLYLVSVTDDDLDDAGGDPNDRGRIQDQKERMDPTMILITKSDLGDSNQIDRLTKRLHRQYEGVPVYPISILESERSDQLAQFTQALKAHLSRAYGLESSPSASNSFYLTNYQKIQLNRILKHLENFLAESKFESGVKPDELMRAEEEPDDHHPRSTGQDLDRIDLVILIEELRLISGLLSKLCFKPSYSSGSDHDRLDTGQEEISTDEVLGEIFQSFCIGK